MFGAANTASVLDGGLEARGLFLRCGMAGRTLASFLQGKRGKSSFSVRRGGEGIFEYLEKFSLCFFSLVNSRATPLYLKP